MLSPAAVDPILKCFIYSSYRGRKCQLREAEVALQQKGGLMRTAFPTRKNPSPANVCIQQADLLVMLCFLTGCLSSITTTASVALTLKLFCFMRVHSLSNINNHTASHQFSCNNCSPLMTFYPLNHPLGNGVSSDCHFQSNCVKETSTGANIIFCLPSLHF